MKYLCLLRPSSELPHPADPAAVYGAIRHEMKEAGAYLDSAVLAPPAESTTVRIQNGETITTREPATAPDDPARGYFILECENIDDAVKWAARIPAAGYGAVEIRPVIS
jgi:hypothetical protein